MTKPNILFAHLSGRHGQFFSIAEYLQKSGIANTYFLGGNDTFGEKFDPSRHFTFEPDGDINNPSYYYSWYAEVATRISLGILRKIKELKEMIPIDIIVGHYVYGSANLLYDEINIPIVTYMEFPSFRHHKWDLQYPPTQDQIINDKAYEMLSNFHLLKSDKVIVPSNYVKSMVPVLFQNKVNIIPDGFDIKVQPIIPKTGSLNTIGFAAKTLSSEKGFEKFIQVTQALLKKDSSFHFIVIGGEEGISYGYDKIFAESKGFKSFKEYLLHIYSVDSSKYTFLGFIDSDKIEKYYNVPDIFLYPLQFGSGNWILFELLSLGKPIIASNRCFLPEVITNGENGILCDYENVDGWIEAIFDLKNNPEKRQKLSQEAIKSAQKYSVEASAKEYMKVFKRLLAGKY